MNRDEQVFAFERLEVWQSARKLVRRIYAKTRTFPWEEHFGLRLQVRRAVVSVASNIAEGTSRRSANDKVRFIEIAYGSLMEVYCQLKIAFDLKMVTDDDFSELRPEIFLIANKLSALKRTYAGKPSR
ncbi:MAG: four helix bundle protein [Opitutales bacterium]|nr:four helix bundle protein [Opitutales bacterium]